MTPYDYFADIRDCECGHTIDVEGTYNSASGTCPACGETIWVCRAEELDSENAERLMDAARDARLET